MKSNTCAFAILCCMFACQPETDTMDPTDSPLMDLGAEEMSGEEDMSSSPDISSLNNLDASMRSDLSVVDAGNTDMRPLADMPQLDMSMPTPTGTPILVAQGRLGRTLVSCDGGLSWGGDRNMAAEGHTNYCGVPQPDAECGRTPCQQVNNKSECVMQPECVCSDHQVGSPTGLTYGDGWFVAIFGHGAPNVVWRSRNGIEWEETRSQGGYQDVAYGDGVFALGSSNFPHSNDGGQTWEEGERIGGLSNMSGMHFSPSKSLFLGFGRNGTARSDDLGQTWRRLEDWPEECNGNFFGQVIQHGDTILFTRGNADEPTKLCISRDGGLTFSPSTTFNASARLASSHDGSQFHLWSSSTHFTTVDGELWSEQPMQGVPTLRAIAHDPAHGRYVAISKGAYEGQRFFHSPDGTSWTELEEGAFPPGAEIKKIVFGYAPEGFSCPE